MKMAAIYRIAFACHMWVGNIMRPVPVYTLAKSHPNSFMRIEKHALHYFNTGLSSKFYFKVLNQIII